MQRQDAVPLTLAIVLGVTLLTACTTPSWTPPIPDATIDAAGLVEDPAPLLELSLAPGDERWILVTLPVLDAGGPALSVAEVATRDDAHVDVRLEWRAADGRVLAVGASGTRYARSFAVLGTPSGGPQPPVTDDEAWACRGPCVATLARTGETYLRVENSGGDAVTLELWAYTRRPSDPNEPNDVASRATRVVLLSDGDGPRGAIEVPGDVDHYRLECGAGFAGPSDGVRVRLDSASELAPALRLTADGARLTTSQETVTLPCGSIVAVSASDGSAGPGAHAWYTLSARAAPLYLVDAAAQPFPRSPTPLGRLTLAPGETQAARFSFPASSASLRVVEAVGASGRSVDGAIALEVRSPAGVVGYSTDRRLFGSTLRALDVLSAHPATHAQPASVTVTNACLGPCVAERYRSGDLVARVTNTTTRTLSVDLLAYGTAESDGNEPNDRAADATPVTVGVGGVLLAGAIERIGDRDVFALGCTPQRAGAPLTVHLSSAFPGALRLQPTAGGAATGAGGSITVACGATVLVETADGTAGPSDASLYVLEVE